VFDYLAKFNDLPKEIRDKVSGPAVLACIDELEKKYGVSLAPLVMKVVVKDIALGELVVYLAEEAKMDAIQAEKLSQELKEKIFINLADYLDIKESLSPKNNTPISQALSASPNAIENKTGLDDLPKPTIQAEKNVFDLLDQHKEKVKPSLPKTLPDVLPEVRKPVVQAPPPPAAPPKPAAKPEDRSAFYFSPEDEEEVRELAKKLESFNPVSQDQYSLDKKIKEIEGEFNISFSSQELLERFRKILKTYLLGIRKRIETKLALVKSFESGGLNLDPGMADKILETADLKTDIPGIEINKPNLIIVPEDLLEQKTAPITNTLINRDAPYDLAALAEKGPIKAKTEIAIPEVEASKPEIKSFDDLKIVIEPSEMDQLNKNTIKPETPKPVMPDPAKMNMINIPVNEKKDKTFSTGSYLSQANLRQNIPVDSSSKTRMDDVKFIPKVMGPIDELRYFDLINYRRLSNDPAKAAAKIKDKIGFLEEEHFNKKIEAIKAWRQSPLNRLYLEVGRQSIEENRPMEVIIEERKEKKQDYLSSQEIEAIMDLNKALRF
jgi:hypothetical protein